MRSMNSLQCLLVTVFLAGCTLGPHYEPPTLDMPEQWENTAGEGINSRSPEDFSWWRSLNDPVLDSLIQTAARQNLDLYIAGTRILEARSQWKGKTGDLYPHIDASLTAGRFHGNTEILKHILGCCHHKGDGKRNINFFEAGFDASWEIDLFGAAKHEINAMQARFEGSQESLNDAWVSLSAEIARQYIELRSQQQRLILLNQTIESQRDTVKLTAELLRIDAASAIDLLQSEEQLSALEAQKPLIYLSIDIAIHRLSVLTGEFPGNDCYDLHATGRLPQLPYHKPIGLPSELLRRRPDIRKAERELATATELVGSAVASLFPRLSLIGFIGDVGTQLKNFSNGSGGTWLAAPQLLLPVFNSKMLQQDVELNKTRAQQALFNYQKIVLSSFEEVENSLASYRYESERNAILEQAVRQADETYQLSWDLYQRGVKSYLEVSTIHRSLLSAQETHLQSETQLLIHYMSLYKALGGAWDPSYCAEEG